MVWDILEKIGIITGIVSSIIGIITFIIKISKRSHFSLKELFLKGDSSTFTWHFMVGFTIFAIISIPALILGIIFPTYILSSGMTILRLLGLFWLGFPIMVIYFWVDDL
jgi:hypothetical protein